MSNPDATQPDRMAPVAALYDIASPEERLVLDTLGAFSLQGAPIPAIVEASTLPSRTCAQILERLSLLSLVQHNGNSHEHYILHPLLYGFCQATLREREKALLNQGIGPEDTQTGRMINFYVRYTDTHREDFFALDTAHNNIIHAAEQAWHNKACDAVYNLWEASELWLDVRGHWISLYVMLEWAVNASRMRRGHEAELAKSLISRSTYFDIKGKVTHALRDAEEGLALGRELGDRKTVASALVRLGSIFSEHHNDAEKAHLSFEAAWRMCHDLPDWDESAYIAYELALSYWTRDDPATAETLFNSAIAISKRFFPRRISRRYEAYCVTCLGNLAAGQGKYGQARELLYKSLELKAGDLYSTSISLNSLARLAIQLGNVENAVKLFWDALAINKRLGALSTLVSTLRQIGDGYSRLLEYHDAVAAYEDARNIGARLEIPKEMGAVLSGLGTAYYRLGRYDKAVAAFSECLRALTTVPKQDRDDIDVALRDIGKAYYRQGALKEARVYLEEVKEKRGEVADAAQLLAEGLFDVGEEYTEGGNHAEALIAYKDGLEMARSSPGENAYQKSVFLWKIGKTHAALGSHDEAVTQFEQAYELLRDLGRPLEIVLVLEDLEGSSTAAGFKEKADAVRADIERFLSEADKSSDASTRTELADYYIEHERLREAQGVLDEVAPSVEQQKASKTKNEQLGDIGRSYHRLGRAYEGGGMYAEALSSYARAAELLESRVRSQVYGVLMHDIGDVHRAQDRLDEAITYYEKAREYKDDPRDVSTLRVLADTYAEKGQHEKALSVYREGLARLDEPSVQ